MNKSLKRVLIIYPHNFFEKNSGINTMFYYFSKSLKQNGFDIDLFSLKNFECKWEKNYPFDKKIVSNLYLYDFCQNNKISLTNKIKSKITNIFKVKKGNHNNQEIENLPDYASPEMKNELKKILSTQRYSHILVGYAYWANLLKDIDVSDAVKVISVNDWLTVQMKDYFKGKINIPNFIKDEIDRINLFDISIEISTFEHQLFSQLASHPKHYLIPIFVEKHKIIKSKNLKYDIAFIAHRNQYNIEGIKWFINEVMPLIPKIKLLIVGKVNTEIGVSKNKNITQIEYIENISNAYKNTKIVICPLFGGTGLKVKIIEALSYGTPVVCTPQSLVGFPYESNNGISVASTPTEFAYQITKLISNQKLYKIESTNAYNFFKKYFSTNVATAKLKEIFNKK